MKPFIGINLDIKVGPPRLASVQMTYIEAIVQSGGVPILLPPMPDDFLRAALDSLDGLMLIGGMDYCPSLYNEEAHPSVERCSTERQCFDLTLAKLALARENFPILGICLGEQLINIQLGGTLIQDIKTNVPDSQLEHSSFEGWKNGFTMHDVNLESDGQLFDIFKKKTIVVSTSHHQSVNKAGAGLAITAYAPDGVVEAVELSDREFVIGVQWHPERDYETQKPLFDRLCQMAALSKERSKR
jgi:gamma-glutamyl-gamma-aminobutyrate hydrolase PuuD